MHCYGSKIWTYLPILTVSRGMVTNISFCISSKRINNYFMNSDLNSRTLHSVK